MATSPGGSIAPLDIGSDICRSDKDHIVIRGHDLVGDLMGRIGIAEMFYLEVMGRLPTPAQARLLEAMTVAVVEHGMMPSTIAARMTDYGSPDSLQSAVAAGLLGAGTRILGSMEKCAQMLWEAKPADRSDPDALAEEIVAGYLRRKAQIPGLGHPIHKPEDPRARKLFDMARTEGVAGTYIDFLHRVSAACDRAMGKHLTINATAAIASVGLDIGLDWRAIKGVALVARTIGIIAHVIEEKDHPTAWEITRYVGAVVEGK